MRLGELIGWSEEQVLAALGEPNENREGLYWRSADPCACPQGRPAAPGAFRRDSTGKIATVHVFGPGPSRIPVGTPYRVWAYHNVRGATWLLYLSRAPLSDTGQAQAGAKLARLFRQGLGKLRPGHRVVVEVYHYPTGAVF